jgi:phage major head subunit gpT-like protein
MTAIFEQWSELHEPGLRAIFEQQRDALAAASRIPTLFSVRNSTKSAEHDLGVGGFGDWREYEGTIEYDEAEQGFKTTYTHVEFARGFAVERKLIDDDQYNIINRRPRQLAMSAMRTREKDAASVFNNAFSSSYVGGDSVALCGAHPLSPSNATTHSNTGTTALSTTSIVATKQLMRTFVDDRGELVQVMPDTILVPPELEETAYVATRTPQIVGSPNNDLNFVNSQGWKVVVWDYLTDANNWFMIDSSLASLYLNWFDRVGLEFAADPTGDYNLEAKFRGYMRYSYGWSDWRWVYGHAVA